MSDDESGSDGGADENQISLEEVYTKFKDEVGHFPHTQAQLLAYCKNNSHPYKFKDIREFWPDRPIKEDKPAEKAVNAADYAPDGDAKSPEAANDANNDDNKDAKEDDDDNDGNDDNNNDDNGGDDNADAAAADAANDDGGDNGGGNDDAPAADAAAADDAGGADDNDDNDDDDDGDDDDEDEDDD